MLHVVGEGDPHINTTHADRKYTATKQLADCCVQFWCGTKGSSATWGNPSTALTSMAEYLTTTQAGTIISIQLFMLSMYGKENPTPYIATAYTTSLGLPHAFTL